MHGIRACLSAQPCSTLATLCTVACQAPLSMGFSRQEYWSGLPFPPRGDLPSQASSPCFLCLHHQQEVCFGLFVCFYHQCHLRSPKTFYRYLKMKRILESAFHIVLIHPSDLVSGLFPCRDFPDLPFAVFLSSPSMDQCPC